MRPTGQLSVGDGNKKERSLCLIKTNSSEDGMLVRVYTNIKSGWRSGISLTTYKILLVFLE